MCDINVMSRQHRLSQRSLKNPKNAVGPYLLLLSGKLLLVSSRRSWSFSTRMCCFEANAKSSAGNQSGHRLEGGL